MMNPASSSSDDNDDDSFSSSSSSTPSEEGAIRTKPLHRRSGNQQSAHSDGDEQEYGDVASSSDEEDGSDDDSEELDDDGVRRNVTNFEDLPTGDSEDDSSDGDCDGDDQSDSDYSHVKKQHSKISRSDDSSEDDMSEDNEDDEKINQEDIPLSERMASRAGLGRRYYTGDGTSYDHGGKQQKAERKHRAIDLASERLREARKGQRKDRHSKQSTSDAEDDHDNDDSSIEQFFSNNNKDNPTTTKVKKSKHAPTEMSSKRQDYFSRGRPDLNSSGIGVSIGANKYKARDPRMISLSGHLDADAFERRYGFLDEIQEKEIELLKSRVKAWKTSGKKGQKARRKLGLTSSGNATSLEADQEELTRLLQERAERQRANVVRAAKRTVKSKLRSEVASGKRGAYYPKRSELKKMEAEAKFDEIRKRGGNEAVDAAIAKRRKKNVAKEARSMPSHMIS